MGIIIIKAWYIGLALGACFAGFVSNVPFFNNGWQKINKFRKWRVSIHEPDLSKLIKKNLGTVVIPADLRGLIALNLKELSMREKTPLLIDLRNIYALSGVNSLVFDYYSARRAVEKL